MIITQQDVDEIVAKAKASTLGLSDGLTHKKGHNQIKQHAKPDLDALALLLVDGYDEKYDLVSVLRAAFEVVERKARYGR